MPRESREHAVLYTYSRVEWAEADRAQRTDSESPLLVTAIVYNCGE